MNDREEKWIRFRKRMTMQNMAKKFRTIFNICISLSVRRKRIDEKIFHFNVFSSAAPMLFPLYFQFMTIRHAYVRKRWTVKASIDFIFRFVFDSIVLGFGLVIVALHSILFIDAVTFGFVRRNETSFPHSVNLFFPFVYNSMFFLCSVHSKELGSVRWEFS